MLIITICFYFLKIHASRIIKYYHTIMELRIKPMPFEVKQERLLRLPPVPESEAKVEEDTDDKVYIRRHAKYETCEKRQVRRELSRQRELSRNEHLKQAKVRRAKQKATKMVR